VRVHAAAGDCTRSPAPFGRPGTPTDQAPIESFFGHIKTEWPCLTIIRDPGELERELGRVRDDYNRVRLHAGIGYVTPTTSTTDAATPSAVRAAKGWPGPAERTSPTIATTERNRRHKPPASVKFIAPICITNSEALQRAGACINVERRLLCVAEWIWWG
jgi:hypothetical protein